MAEIVEAAHPRLPAFLVEPARLPELIFVDCYDPRCPAKMIIDRYTKLVLTVIGLALATIAGQSITRPNGVAAAGALTDCQFSVTLLSWFAVNTRTGEIWGYDLKQGGQAQYFGKISEVGKPLVKQPMK